VTDLQSSAEKPPFELKGRMASLAILRLFSDDLDGISAHLRTQINRAPSLFRGAPLAIDVAALKSEGLDLGALTRLLREQCVVPVAIRGGSKAAHEAARELNLGVLEWQEATVTKAESAADEQSRSSSSAPPKPEKSASPPPASANTSTRVITQPVRSGQQVYARGGDLLILGQVSAGAEVIADGHIHVYGKLHGRALAGAQGDAEARIFVQSLEAELMAVAGVYRVSEEIDENLRGAAVQAYLQAENLVLEPL
jgi:septum site-determining protein MinC